MKVLLIMPPSGKKNVLSGDSYFLHEPLALEYVSAGIKAHHDVKLLDMRIDKHLEKTLREYGPDIVGITGYTIHVNTCIRILKTVKDINPGILTVIGGHHATISPETFCGGYVDVIVLGEGVSTFKQVVEASERGNDLKEIEGIGIPKDSTMHLTPHREHAPLDTLPFPDRSLTSHYRHCYFTSKIRPIASLRTSVGCAYRCNFCALWKIAGMRYITRKAACIVEELSTIQEPYVLFADDETFLDAKAMMFLADRIKEAGINKKYHVSMRADTVVKNPQLIAKWSSIGLSIVRIGIESYLDSEIQSFNKKTSVSDNEQALRILDDNGINVVSQFIIRQDYDRNRFKELARYVKAKGIKHSSFSILTPLPGTILYESVKDKLISTDYELYDFKHTLLPTMLPLREFYREFAMLHARCLAIWRYVLYRFAFPLTRFIPTFGKGYHMLSSMKNAYNDHG